MRKANALLSLLLVACAIGAPVVAAPSAAACGVAYPAKSYARVSGERAVVVWDAASKREHFVRKPTFDGDAKDFGYFLPTPTVPVVAKESDALVDKVAALAQPPVVGGAPGSGGRPGPPHGARGVSVMQTLRIDDFELVTLKADSADALGDWLKSHAFVDRPNLRAWSKAYLAKGWVISAMRYVAPATPTERADAGAGAAHNRPPVATPTLRFSFTIDAPFYPYTEPQADPKDEAAYLARTGKLGLETRPLFVWLVASEPLEAFQGESLSGPYLHASHEVSGATLASALGDTKPWGFDPEARPTWTVTYLNQYEDRVAKEDLTFAKARVLLPTPEVSAPVVTAPTAPQAQSQALRGRLHSKRFLALFGGLALLLVVGLTVFRELYETPKKGA